MDIVVAKVVLVDVMIVGNVVEGVTDPVLSVVIKVPVELLTGTVVFGVKEPLQKLLSNLSRNIAINGKK